ncbi:MAG: DNA mismatch repair endonuclease MutL [Candidatus Lokiarchaeota archaeon]|nr:DNA mismatch repair endonuclease MutL [Candidatus Lokiarchaeota archaeon]
MPNGTGEPKRIRFIRDHEKIAAGEVIERPASVVKELVENSIDAGATEITIIIKNYGKELIQVIDNGCGINPDDVEFAFAEHTSSKIECADDLNNLYTLGFRGEALHSISAISKIELITKQNNSDMGLKFKIEGGENVSAEHVGCLVGTNIKVKDLFYNTPVRYKFLKTDRVEMGHITDIITRLVLAYPKIHFKLVHNDIPIINSPSTDRYQNVIFDLYGKKVVKNLIEFEYKDNEMKIWGYLGDPSLSRSTTLSSSLFVNGRYVVSPLVKNAMETAYKGYIMVKKHPFYILFLKLNPSTVDFNIHPTKKVIRFENSTEFLKKLTRILKIKVNEKFGKLKTESRIKEPNSISEYKIGKILESEDDNKLQKVAERQKSSVEDTTNVDKHDMIVKSKKSKPEIGAPKAFDIKLDQIYPGLNGRSKTISEKENPSKLRNLARQSNWIETHDVFPKFRIPNQTSQLNQVYFVLEGIDGFYLLDMHAAHERINYERVLRNFKDRGIKKQTLLIPIKFDVSVNEVEFVKELCPKLSKFGFEVDSLGGSTFIIRTVPANFKKSSDPTFIRDLCLEIISKGKQTSIEEEYDSILKLTACRMSIKAGEEIDNPETVIKLIQDLAKCKNPHHCCHGRPTMLYFDYKEIEKMFHRT